MAKIMLVEDDNNLREIYEARLLAEGHEIISAHDGEEALAIAVREKPELIISDVMMPKISGFDMLDILRSSPETKNTKIIMMTALSQAEDKDRADRLGADRYLVKSQVTLEDVIRVTHEVLESPVDSSSNVPEPIAPIRGNPTSSAPDQTVPATPVSDMPATDTPVAPIPEPVISAPVAPDVPEPVAPAPEPTTPVAPAPEPATPASDLPVPDPLQSAPDPEVTPASAPEAPVIPTPEALATPDLPTPEAVAPEVSSQIDSAQTVGAEQDKVEEQINSFISSNLTGDSVAIPDPEAPVITASEAPAEQNPPIETPAPAVPDGFMPESAPNTTAPPTLEASPEPAPDVAAPTSEAPAESSEPAASPSLSKKTIQPIGDPTATPDLEALAAAEAEKEQARQILASADIPAASEPAPAPSTAQSEQKPDDPTAIAL